MLQLFGCKKPKSIILKKMWRKKKFSKNLECDRLLYVDGCYLYVLKPFSNNQLVCSVRNCVFLKRLFKVDLKEKNENYLRLYFTNEQKDATKPPLIKEYELDSGIEFLDAVRKELARYGKDLRFF